MSADATTAASIAALRDAANGLAEQGMPDAAAFVNGTADAYEDNLPAANPTVPGRPRTPLADSAALPPAMQPFESVDAPDDWEDTVRHAAQRFFTDATFHATAILAREVVAEEVRRRQGEYPDTFDKQTIQTAVCVALHMAAPAATGPTRGDGRG